MPAAARPHDARDRYQLTSGGLSDDAGCCILASPATAGCGNLAASAAAGLARQRSVLARPIAAVDPNRSDEQNGRASCREQVCKYGKITVVPEQSQKKTQLN